MSFFWKATALIIFYMLLCTTAFADDDFDVVTITVNTSAYDATKPPQFAQVKYNKLCPLVITSDDMGRVEFVRNWAFFNGYPVLSSNYFGQLDDPATLLEAPYNSTTQSWQEPELKATSWQPLTYSDGTGGVRRFTATSAIMPYKIANANYSFINPQMAKTMVRTGWSFAQHDVADKWPSGVSTDEQQQQYITEQLPIQSRIMEDITGVGLKVIVEPNGNKNYIKAGIASDEICWLIYQNANSSYPPQSKLISDWTNTNRSLPTTFTQKPTGAWERFFFQSQETVLKTNHIDTADGTSFVMGGTHGMTNAALNVLKDIAQTGSSAKKDQFWVAGADEVWEYYNLYNSATIENVSYADGKLTFDIKVPKYKKHQFRELTINIPGVANGTDCTFSDNVITSGAAQNAEQYTINIGLEDHIYTHLDELLAYYRSHLHNDYVKRDAQYLINLLTPGTKKNEYQAKLDADPIYSYTVKNSFGTVLTSGSSDVATEVNYKYPKYILNEGKLYESSKNTNRIQGTNHVANYVGAFTPEGKNQIVTVGYTATQTAGSVVYYSEGEDLDGVTIATEDFSKIGNNSGIAFALRYASNGGAGEILHPVTATTLTPGKYTLVTAIGDTHTSATAQFTFKVGGKTVLSQTTEDVSGYIKEYTKEGITVKTDQPLTVEAVNSGGSFWLDYLYIIKTGEYDASTPDVELTTATPTIDMTDDSNKAVTITATATAKGDAKIVKTVIKDSDDRIVAENTAATCSYTFMPSHVGDVVFTAEATDNTEDGGSTGLSDELTVTVKSDFTLKAVSNMGDEIKAATFSGQTADKSYKFLYPRFILKGTDLYETEAKGTANNMLHYGEELTFTLANKTIERTVDYAPTAPNVVFYTEGEDVAGTRQWTNQTFDKNQGQSYALTLGSMGVCGAFKTPSQGGNTVTTLPAGQYKLTAIIGSTNANAPSSDYVFKAGQTEIGTFTPTPSTDKLSTYTTEDFTLAEAADITVSSSKGTDNSQNWIDLIYIQKLNAVPVTVTDAGYATFSSPYALDFTSVTDVTAYTALADHDVVRMTKVTGAVPARTGLFLQGTVGTAVSTSVPLATTVVDPVTENHLVAHVEAGEVAAGNYLFSRSKSDGSLAFRILESPYNMTGGRSYLDGSAVQTVAGSRAASLRVQWFDAIPSGISSAEQQPTSAQKYYNLQGQQVGQPTKGIYVTGGKIIISK